MKIILLIITLLLSGCFTPFNEYYENENKNNNYKTIKETNNNNNLKPEQDSLVEIYKVEP